MVEQGEHPLVIARRLGHTSVKTVLFVYGHLFDGIDQEAARSPRPTSAQFWCGPDADQTDVGRASG